MQLMFHCVCNAVDVSLCVCNAVDVPLCVCNAVDVSLCVYQGCSVWGSVKTSGLQTFTHFNEF